MPTEQVVCWTCFRWTDQLTPGTYTDPYGHSEITADMIGRWDADRETRMRTCTITIGELSRLIDGDPWRMRCTITGQTDCAQRDCELHYMNAPVQFAD